jgi:hypothetical protein
VGPFKKTRPAAPRSAHAMADGEEKKVVSSIKINIKMQDGTVQAFKARRGVRKRRGVAGVQRCARTR